MAWLSSTAVRVSRARLTGGELIPWRARPASSSPAVPGWAMASAALSPVVMIGGWLAAEALQPPSYSPVRSTISGLAGLGGTDRWIMISALFVVGAGYFVTAAGLPGVRVPARIVLMVAGLSSIGIAVSPEPVRGSTPQHLAWTSLGAAAITIWPAFTARRAPSQPLILRARGAGAVTAVFLALLAWVVFETQGGTALGLAERLVSAVQVTWPFVVALALRRAAGPGGTFGPWPGPGLRTRVAGCLLLLYAQPVSRLARLTLDDIITGDDGQVFIRLGDPPTPVPEPFAAMLTELAANRVNMNTAANPGCQWLFPGQRVGQPLMPIGLRRQLHELGIPLTQARTAAFRQLVLQAPPPVVARSLGFDYGTATEHAIAAGGTWNRYPAARRDSTLAPLHPSRGGAP
jgi:hypothetical membrane protein